MFLIVIKLYFSRIFIALLLVVVVVVAEDPSAECSENSCIVSNSIVTNTHFNEIIDETSYSVVALKFDSCYMDVIPLNVFTKLPSLLYLTITAPGVNYLEQGDFETATHLELLNASGNRLTRLEKFTFKGASNLSELNLSENKIETVHIHAFLELGNLKTLNLSKNKILFFGKETFAPLEQLYSMDVSQNQLEYLDVKFIYNNYQLHDINASDNKIERVTNGFLKILPHVKVLNMMRNPCINDTLLDFFPYVKDDGKTLMVDERSLKKCYENYLKAIDPESMDLEVDMTNILDHVALVRDDIEVNIIAEQNEDLRDRDSNIESLKRRDDVFTILLLLGFVGVCFYMLVTIIMSTVNEEYKKQVDKKKGTKDTIMELIPKGTEEVELPKKEDHVIYTINI